MINAANEKHNKVWERFREVIGAEKIKYTDLGVGENYQVHMPDGLIFTIQIRGNKVDGAFAILEII
jgi:hypothetical protein